MILLFLSVFYFNLDLIYFSFSISHYYFNLFYFSKLLNHHSHFLFLFYFIPALFQLVKTILTDLVNNNNTAHKNSNTKGEIIFKYLIWYEPFRLKEVVRQMFVKIYIWRISVSAVRVSCFMPVTLSLSMASSLPGLNMMRSWRLRWSQPGWTGRREMERGSSPS